MKQNKICVYAHGSCYDGYGALFSAYLKLGKSYKATSEYITYDRDVEYKTCHYGKDDFDHHERCLIYFVDYCPSKDVLRKLSRENLVIVLDHHKTAQDALDGFATIDLSQTHEEFMGQVLSGECGVRVLFDMKRSGAGIAWDFFHRKTRPEMINWLEDRDLWNFKYPESNMFHAFMLSQPFDIQVWEGVFNSLNDPEERGAILVSGKNILKYQSQIVKNIIAKAEEVWDAKYKFCVVNTTSHWSEVGNDLLEKFPDSKFSVSLSWLPTYRKVQMSFRSRKDFDVSRIALQFGGGGHPQASGATIGIGSTYDEIVGSLVTAVEKLED